jgi:hypothetical protein
MKTSLAIILICSFDLLQCDLIGADATPTAPSGFGAGIGGTAEDHFRTHLGSCTEDEVRCIWFSGDRVFVGMIMTLDLKAQTVCAFIDGYNWARTGALTRKLTRGQTLAAKETVTALPAGLPNVPFAEGLHIAFWLDKKLHTVTYSRKAVPRIVQRLYDLGGGESDFTYAK